MELKKNTTIELQIEGIGSQGEGIGSWRGLKIFIRGALIGEQVLVKITEIKKNYATASLEKILKKSPQRRTPPCSYFASCGGCQIMHLDDQAQLTVKRDKIVAAMQRIAHLDVKVLDTIPSPKNLHYRNKIQLPVKNTPSDTLQMGLYAFNSHNLIPIDHCLIHNKYGQSLQKTILELLKNYGITAFCQEKQKGNLRFVVIKSACHAQEELVIFVTNGKNKKAFSLLAQDLAKRFPRLVGVVENVHTENNNRILGKNFRTLFGRDYLTERILDKTFKISCNAFFQVNPFAAEILYQRAMELAAIEKHHIVLDAFCGVGTLALFASDHAKKVIGIECIAKAIENAKENAYLNQIKNCRFLVGKAEKLIHLVPKAHCVFLNPPRKGCDPFLIKTLLEIGPQRIVYISCDPATLARDLALLRDFYTIGPLQPLDMFPQTMHVETLVALTKK